jgi:hypothetical protein
MRTTKRVDAEKLMTVGMLEDELRKIKIGLAALIKEVKGMDRRDLVTNVASRAGPKPCIVVEWGECCLGRVSGRLKTRKIAPALHALALSMGRLARYVDEHTKPR